MPAKSQAQFRLMHAVASGSANIPGLSKSEAREYTAGQSPKGLPTRKYRKGRKKVKRGRRSNS